MRTKYFILMALISLMLDGAVSTPLGLTLIPGAYECNPRPAWFYAHFGIPGILAFSVISMLFVLGILLLINILQVWSIKHLNVKMQEGLLVKITCVLITILFATNWIHNFGLLISHFVK